MLIYRHLTNSHNTMDATTFIMNCYGIQQDYKEDVERIIAGTRHDLVDLALMNLGQHPDDDDFDAELDKWPLAMRISTAAAAE